MIRITELRLPLEHPPAALAAAITTRLGIAADQLRSFTVYTRSHDARKKTALTFIYTVDVEVDDEGGWYALLGARAQLARNLALFVEGKYTWIDTSIEKLDDVGRETGIDWMGGDLDFSGLALNAGMLFTF